MNKSRNGALKLGILVSGAGTTLEAVAEAIEVAGGIEPASIPARIVLVASDRPGVPAMEKAASHGFPTLVVSPPPRGPKDWEELLSQCLKGSGCELVVLAGFQRILKGPLLDAFPGRIINLHPALLPKFSGHGMYGTRVHAAVLASGDSTTGSTVHMVTRDVDRGPVIAQRTIAVRKGDTPESLALRQRPLEHALLIDVIGRFARGELSLPWHGEGLTYASSGVDTREVGRALSALLRSVRYRPPSSHGSSIGKAGHYAGLVRVGKTTLALTTDGVGTKVLIAEALGRWEEVGEDVVAVNANDILAVGATPSTLVDYIACRKPEPSVLSKIGRGLDRGLRKAQCSLLGGETAVVPEMLNSRYDISATALGFFPKGQKPILGEALKAGDVLLGLPSSGFHANGYTLIRRILLEKHFKLTERVRGERLPLGGALLKPTRIYLSQVEPLLRARLPVALAHITGGGFRNLPRLNPKVSFVIDDLPKPDGLFRWVGESSSLLPKELYQTFNMGIGFVVGVRPGEKERALRLLRKSGEKEARVIGHVERGSGVLLPREGVHYTTYYR